MFPWKTSIRRGCRTPSILPIMRSTLAASLAHAPQNFCPVVMSVNHLFDTVGPQASQSAGPCHALGFTLVLISRVTIMRANGCECQRKKRGSFVKGWRKRRYARRKSVVMNWFESVFGRKRGFDVIFHCFEHYDGELFGVNGVVELHPMSATDAKLILVGTEIDLKLDFFHRCEVFVNCSRKRNHDPASRLVNWRLPAHLVGCPWKCLDRAGGVGGRGRRQAACKASQEAANGKDFHGANGFSSANEPANVVSMEGIWVGGKA